MDANRSKVREMSIARTIERLRKNNMEAVYLPAAQDVVPMLRSMLEEQCVIALGGSVTLAETGALKLVRSDMYRLIDRYEPGLTPHQQCQRHHRAWGTVLCGRHEQPGGRDAVRAETGDHHRGMAEDRADAAGRRRPGETYRGTGERDAP
jgi:hypothetical protein